MAINVDSQETVFDPYKQKATWSNWNKKIETISERNEEMIVKYLEDMRQGRNLNPKVIKGKRGYHRLNNQKHRLKRIAELLEEHYDIKDIAPTNSQAQKKLESSLRDLFEKMEEGKIVKHKITRGFNNRYTSVRDYVKGIKAFWHWFQVYSKKEMDVEVHDIMEYITVKENKKPKFVYFGEKGSKEKTAEWGFKKLINAAKPDYKPLMAVLFDTGSRVTELLNVRRMDISVIEGSPYYLLKIRDEASKTFGREIKLILSHEVLKNYLAEEKFKPEEFIFKVNTSVVNQYISRLGERILGKQGITMYDFRHNSACYWLPRYPSESALMYRFGWKNSEMIHYYTELMGMKDTIQAEDLLIDVTKTDLQKQLDSHKQENVIMQEQIKNMASQLEEMRAYYKEKSKQTLKAKIGIN